MATLAQDTTLTGGRGTPNAISPGSDGSTWTQQRSNQTLSFTGSAIGMAQNGNTTLGVLTYSALSEQVVEELFDVTPAAAGDLVGGVLCFQGTDHFYYAVIGNTAGKFEIGKDIAGAFTQLTFASFAWSAGNTYTIRFQYGMQTSTTLAAKIWLKSGSEPGPWTVTTTDAALATGGHFGVCGAPVGTADLFDAFLVTDGASFTVNTMAATDSTVLSERWLLTDSVLASETLALSSQLAQQGQMSSTDSTPLSESLSMVAQTALAEQAPFSEAWLFAGMPLASAVLTASSQLVAQAVLSVAESTPFVDAFGVVLCSLASEHAPVSTVWMPVVLSLMSATESAPLTDGSQSVGIALASEVLTATDGWQYTQQAVLWEVLTSLAESASWTTVTPSVATIDVVWVTRDGTVTWVTRDGAITWEGRTA